MPDPRTIMSVAVVMPAHNEDRHIGSALVALKTAADALQQEHPEVPVSVSVVLDSCTDRSADITAAYVAGDSRFGAVNVELRSTGASRDFGIRASLDGLPAEETAKIWLATTDSDSTVPEQWLVRQVELANAGADAILGSVEPDPGDVEPAILRRWLELHPFVEDHPHIYGANLGIRASAYLAVGGFPTLRAHEDHVLVDRLRSHGFAVTATDTTRVVTSGRLQARAPEGFAAYLRALGAELPAATG
ncbi:Glycosyl transferase family 2 [Arthrobacter sp. yr096]|uniref:glycosyltransferase n=1 Tax=unclassified Arthrobacter TaxID=235627 RepID=UPI0008984159|nr:MULTISPECIES: glycosyltransferase [unclassified Arthrobacter]SDW77749.1 Glycosyl transferase family 2 [Arthrobacter sp. cf158]SEJ41980.1 Glycosyl transferase family 2 [Arthrobacter sp. yr096]